MFNVLEIGDGESNDHMEANDTFQQETITDVVPIDIENNVQYCRDNVELEVIQEDEIMAEHRKDDENEVFYLPNTKSGESWQDMQCVQHTGMFDVPEIGDGEFNDYIEANDAFQQKTITDVVSIDIENNVQYRRDDVEPKVIQEDEIIVEHRKDDENKEHDITHDNMDYDM